MKEKVTMEELLSTLKSPQVERITGLSLRQLQYWNLTAFFVPSGSGKARGQGHHARYTFTDIVELAAVKRFLDDGVSLNRLRSVKVVMDKLDLHTPFCCLVVAGDDVMACTDKDELISVLTRPGQQAFRTVDVSAVVREVKAKVERMVAIA